MRHTPRILNLTARTTLAVLALLVLGACADDSPSTAPAASDDSSTETPAPSTESDEVTTEPAAARPPAITVARQVVGAINRDQPRVARRHATRSAVRRMVDLHGQGFDFVRPPRCRGEDDSRLCRSDLVVPSGGGTSSNLRLRLVHGQWRVTGVEGLD